jgi:hypothetical protein
MERWWGGEEKGLFWVRLVNSSIKNERKRVNVKNNLCFRQCHNLFYSYYYNISITWSGYGSRAAFSCQWIGTAIGILVGIGIYTDFGFYLVCVTASRGNAHGHYYP